MKTSTKLAAALAAMTLATSVEAVTFDTWSISGPGTTSVTSSNADNTDVTFSYNTMAFSGTWSATTTVLAGGTYDFSWLYNGMHAWYAAQEYLNVTSPTSQALVSSGSFGGFSYTGTSVLSLVAGDVLTFTFGGSNGDYNNFLNGTIALTENLPAVPLPATGAALLGAIGAMAVVRRRKTALAPMAA